MDHTPGTGPRQARPSTEEKYRVALELYRTTGLPAREICAQTHVKLSGFRAYIQRYHREEMFARYGLRPAGADAGRLRMRRPRGQTKAAHEKYRKAILACDSLSHIGYNVSQIARMFHLNPTSLGNQLRAHYPEILERRERERERLGIQNNLHHGVRPQSRSLYAQAVEQLWHTDKSIGAVARELGVSPSGLHEHLLFYHKKLILHRADKRMRACMRKIPGAMTGNGAFHLPSAAIAEKYREAVRLFATTSLPLYKIAAMSGVSVGGLRNHLRTWHMELILARRGGASAADPETGLAQTKRYSKAASAKYAEAIAELRRSECSTAEIAARYGLHPECFRSYLREHEPELFARQGMKRRADGRRVSCRSEERYGEAIRLYETTVEPLKSIALRLGLPYNSLGGFVRRNHPDAIARHNELVRSQRQTYDPQQGIDR